MKIDGKKIALEIYDNLKIRVEKLKGAGIVPQIAVILIGDDPASKSYITQKEKWCEYIGAQFSYIHFSENVSEGEVLKSLENLNSDTKIHGIIVQRPLPKHIEKQKIINAINLEKDIDGFHKDSIYDVPVAQAVLRILTEIHTLATSSINFLSWLQTKSIIVIGKGETAGGPIINYLEKNGLHPTVVSSQTVNSKNIIINADIVISAVGKPEIIKPDYLKPDAIILGVGLYKGEDDKLYGDYVARDIESTASYFTPIIGGIGPVNVAYLLTNLVNAAEKQDAIK